MHPLLGSVPGRRRTLYRLRDGRQGFPGSVYLPHRSHCDGESLCPRLRSVPFGMGAQNCTSEIVCEGCGDRKFVHTWEKKATCSTACWQRARRARIQRERPPLKCNVWRDVLLPKASRRREVLLQPLPPALLPAAGWLTRAAHANALDLILFPSRCAGVRRDRKDLGLWPIPSVAREQAARCDTSDMAPGRVIDRRHTDNG